MNNDKIIQAILKVKLLKWLMFCLSVIRWKAWTQVFVCCPGGETRTGGEICPHQLQPQNQWEKVPQFFIKTWRCQQILLLWKLCAWMTKHYFSTCYNLHTRPSCMEDVMVCICVIFQSIYALVEFTNQESVASLLEEAAIPTVSHEALVPFKSRLLSLKNSDSVGFMNQPYQPQTTAPINQLIQRLSIEESVSGLVVTHIVTVLIKQSRDSTLITTPTCECKCADMVCHLFSPLR